MRRRCSIQDLKTDHCIKTTSQCLSEQFLFAVFLAPPPSLVLSLVLARYRTYQSLGHESRLDGGLWTDRSNVPEPEMKHVSRVQRKGFGGPDKHMDAALERGGIPGDRFRASTDPDSDIACSHVFDVYRTTTTSVQTTFFSIEAAHKGDIIVDDDAL